MSAVDWLLSSPHSPEAVLVILGCIGAVGALVPRLGFLGCALVAFGALMLGHVG